jgi:hypothetical protein
VPQPCFHAYTEFNERKTRKKEREANMDWEPWEAIIDDRLDQEEEPDISFPPCCRKFNSCTDFVSLGGPIPNSCLLFSFLSLRFRFPLCGIIFVL